MDIDERDAGQAPESAASAVEFRSATEMAGMLRRREISARELTDLTLDRIDQLNPVLNAITEVPPDPARAAAAAADQAVGAGRSGPLLGLPMTIKEAFNVAGFRTTWGEPAFADYVADSDATIAARLLDAGVIIAAKTNVATMLADYQTANALYGVSRNPWDLSRTPGGSTGGGAAALAAGLTFLEYGSDLAGSIRIPAAFCGVYGLKPSVGTVPMTGLQPPGPAAPPSEMSHVAAVGPLARSAADLRTALIATAGLDGPASDSYTWRLAPPRHRRLRDFRVGFALDHPGCPVSAEITAVLAQVVDQLAALGVTLSEGWPDGVDPVAVSESFGYHVQLFLTLQGAGDPSAEAEPLVTVIEHENRRLAVRAAWQRYFGDVDVFLCPVTFTTAFSHDARPFAERTIDTPDGMRRYDALPFWIAQASLPGLPAVAAPVGRTAAGLPVGAQLIGPLHEDDTALTFAELLTEVTGGFTPPQLG
jgi:amidase